ncbi:MAG: hypothetical protein ACE5Z5_09700 [Candidatus Bathyarchaeia archaeon]
MSQGPVDIVNKGEGRAFLEFNCRVKPDDFVSNVISFGASVDQVRGQGGIGVGASVEDFVVFIIEGQFFGGLRKILQDPSLQCLGLREGKPWGIWGMAGGHVERRGGGGVEVKGDIVQGPGRWVRGN